MIRKCFTMAYHLNIIQLLLGVSVLCVSNPLRIYHVHVNIFVERSNAEIKNIAQKAIEFYCLDHGNISPENKIRLNLSLVTYDKVINRITNLDDDRFFNCNIKTTLCAAIFVQFSSHEIFLSSLMERLNIISVGLFQTSGNPLSQVRSPALCYSCFSGCTEMKQRPHWVVFASTLRVSHLKCTVPLSEDFNTFFQFSPVQCSRTSLRRPLCQ